MTPKPRDDQSDDLPSAEAARARRRDRDATAAERSGMRTGLAKQFKQVLDAQVKRGRAAGEGDEEPLPDGRPPGSSRTKRRKRGQPPGDTAPEP